MPFYIKVDTKLRRSKVRLYAYTWYGIIARTTKIPVTAVVRASVGFVDLVLEFWSYMVFPSL